MQLARVRDNVLIFLLFLFFCWLLPHLPSAWSVDPTSRLTGVVQKKQSPQGVPLRPGTKKRGRKKKTKKPKVLTPKYMGHVQASSHKWWNSTLPTFLTVSFSEWDQYRSCGFICCPCASIISSPQIEKVTWLIASKHRESCSLSLSLVPVSLERQGHHRSIRVSSWSRDIWGRRCSPTASSVWRISISMTCSIWKFPSSPVGQGQLVCPLLWQMLGRTFACFFRAKVLKKTWPRRAAFS